MTTAEVMTIVGLVERIGVPAVKAFVHATSKEEITIEDWNELSEKLSKTPEEYLEEARARLNK